MYYDPQEFCSTQEAARILGVALRTVQLWVESGVLQAWKTAGGHRRIVRSSVQKLVEERERAKRPVAQSAAAAASRGATILVVDDDETMLKLYRLEIAGWSLPVPVEVVTARDGFEGLIKIGEVRPSLLITDISMPGMDGFKMIRTLRAHSHYRNMAIIVATGLDRESVSALGLPGDVPVFAKPVPFGQLRDAVAAVLEKASPVASFS